MDKFRILKDFFEKKDTELIENKGSRVFDTSHGIFGVSHLEEVNSFFTQIGLENSKGIVDLGSGDGRIAILASLFTKSLGVEADSDLNILAQTNLKEIQKIIPEATKCKLVEDDYTGMDFSDYDVLFTYIDHKWPLELEENLLKKWKGTVYCYRNIFPPEKLKKGKTYWAGQTPIVSYIVGASPCADSSFSLSK